MLSLPEKIVWGDSFVLIEITEGAWRYFRFKKGIHMGRLAKIIFKARFKIRKSNWNILSFSQSDCIGTFCFQNKN